MGDGGWGMGDGGTRPQTIRSFLKFVVVNGSTRPQLSLKVVCDIVNQATRLVSPDRARCDSVGTPATARKS
ncbi:MAG: hypothetical protein V9G20_18070 [Candidatus Promineifilaceae bacterium]